MLYQLELQLFPYKSQGLLGGGGERERDMHKDKGAGEGGRGWG